MPAGVRDTSQSTVPAGTLFFFNPSFFLSLAVRDTSQSTVPAGASPSFFLSLARAANPIGTKTKSIRSLSYSSTPSIPDYWQLYILRQTLIINFS
jgi:hypothetical protein